MSNKNKIINVIDTCDKFSDLIDSILFESVSSYYLKSLPNLIETQYSDKEKDELQKMIFDIAFDHISDFFLSAPQDKKDGSTKISQIQIDKVIEEVRVKARAKLDEALEGILEEVSKNIKY